MEKFDPEVTVLEKEHFHFDKVQEKLKTLVLDPQDPKRYLTKQYRDDVSTGRDPDGITGYAHVCPGFMQLNFVIMPEKLASDFIEFCKINPSPMPIVEYSKPGDLTLPLTLPFGGDLKKSCGHFSVYEKGVYKGDLKTLDSVWKEDSVAVVYGCSFSFDTFFLGNGWEFKHQKQKKIVSMLRTTYPVKPYGVFQKGFLVVTMRPVKKDKIEDLIKETNRLKTVHGPPIYYGHNYTEKLGIKDLQKPEWGDPIEIADDEVPAFWACGLTFVTLIEENDMPYDMAICGADRLLISDILVNEIADLF